MTAFSRHTYRIDTTRQASAPTRGARRPDRCTRIVAVLASAVAGTIAAVALAMPQQSGAMDGAQHAGTHESTDSSIAHSLAQSSVRNMTGAAHDSGAPLQLSRAWIRAMPPGRNMTAAYLTVTNPRGTAITIRGVSASRGNATLHKNRRVNDQVQMRALETLIVPAYGEVSLEPGGLHIMLMELASTPAEGESLRLCLESTAGPACIDTPVLRRAPDATASSSDDARHRH